MKRSILVALTGVLVNAVSGAPMQNSEGLFSAIRAGDPAAVRAAIAAGTDANAKDKDGNPALMYAAIVANAETMRALLDKGADVNAANPAGATALIYGAADSAKATLLISRGANVNVQSGPGATPLFVASSAEDNAAVVKLMLSKGAQVNVHDHIEGIPALLSGGGSTPPLTAAARLRNSETLRVLLAAGADVNAKDANGATALTDAVLYDNPENVRLLLAADATVNFPIGVWKQTPLIAAAMRRNPKVVQMLVKAGAEVNGRDASDSTPLMWAAYSEYDDPGPVNVLIAAGADVNRANKWGETALTWALRRGETSIVAALRKAGAQESGPAPQSVPVSTVSEKEIVSIRAAVEKGLPPLQALGEPTFKKTGCFSCHNTLIPMTAAGVARDRGFKYSAAQLAENAKLVSAFMGPAAEPLRQGLDLIPDIPLTGGYILEAMHAAAIAPNGITDALVHRIAQSQSPDGHFDTWAPRPPIEYSEISATAFAIRSMALYGSPGRRTEFEQRIGRAQKWLETAAARTGEERATRLMGLAWAGAKPETIHNAIQDVLGYQREDGGWAPLDTLGSDAYSTGQTLYALHEAGFDVTAGAYRRGVSWLRKTQEPDGSWRVKTRAFPLQKLVDTGYGHGRDQWISSQASSWAVMALMFAEQEPASIAAASAAGR